MLSHFLVGLDKKVLKLVSVSILQFIVTKKCVSFDVRTYFCYMCIKIVVCTHSVWVDQFLWVSSYMFYVGFCPWCWLVAWYLHLCICGRGWGKTRVNQVIYDQFGGWFCVMPGGQNNHKLVINTPDLLELGVIKCHSIYDLIFLWLLSGFLLFSSSFWHFGSIITRCDRYVDVFLPSPIVANEASEEKLITPSNFPSKIFQ